MSDNIHGGIAALANKLADKGRYGDDHLVHMSGEEIALLERLTGHKMTINPQTGQPEAFSLWKLLAGIGAAIAVPFTGGLSSALIGPALGMGVSAFTDPGKQKMADAKQMEQERIAKLQQQAKDTVQVPMLNTVQSPGPVYTPEHPAGIVPEKMQILQQNLGTITPGPNYYARGGPVQYGTGSAGPGAFEGLLHGPGAGMDDQIQATTTSGQRLALSNNEYVMPADIVSSLGDGATSSGAQVLDQMIARIRKIKTGRAAQPPKLNLTQVLPQ
jgi:hypothetical protein